MSNYYKSNNRQGNRHGQSARGQRRNLDGQGQHPPAQNQNTPLQHPNQHAQSRQSGQQLQQYQQALQLSGIFLMPPGMLHFAPVAPCPSMVPYPAIAHQAPNQAAATLNQGQPHNTSKPPSIAPGHTIRDICAECGGKGHTNKICCNQCDEFGFMETCPKCNPKDGHGWDVCPIPKEPGDEVRYLLKYRHGKPAVMSRKDFRLIEGFDECPWRPLTPGYALILRDNNTFLNYHQYNKCKSYHDRNWTEGNLPPMGGFSHPIFSHQSIKPRQQTINTAKRNRDDASSPELAEIQSMANSKRIKREDNSTQSPTNGNATASTEKRRPRLIEILLQFEIMKKRQLTHEEEKDRFAKLRHYFEEQERKITKEEAKDAEEMAELTRVKAGLEIGQPTLAPTPPDMDVRSNEPPVMKREVAKEEDVAPSNVEGDVVERKVQRIKLEEE